jgi:hypothetical protein
MVPLLHPQLPPPHRPQLPRLPACLLTWASAKLHALATRSTRSQVSGGPLGNSCCAGSAMLTGKELLRTYSTRDWPRRASSPHLALTPAQSAAAPASPCRAPSAPCAREIALSAVLLSSPSPSTQASLLQLTPSPPADPGCATGRPPPARQADPWPCGASAVWIALRRAPHTFPLFPGQNP